MKRIKFKKKGKQKEFLKLVLEKTGCPSIKELSNRLLEIPYSTWRNYFSELRLIQLNLFEKLIELSNLKKEGFDFEIINNNWGQIKGGKNGPTRN